MNLGPTKISGTYVYVLNQSGANPITLGNNGAVNWSTAGIPNATTSVSGFMSASDKIKLDGVATNANNYVHPTQTAINVDATNNGVNIIDSVLVDTLGHVTSVTTRNLSAATSTTSGVVSADAQTIGGLKTFTDGVISSVGVTGTNLVYNTGAQNIGGLKTFTNGVISSVGITGTNLVYNTGSQTIDGAKTFTSIVNANITGNAGSVTNGVYITGSQTIGGLKTFSDTGSFNTLEITNKKISSYSYNSTNFAFSNNYLNLANSSNSLTGTLPNPIISGMNYYVKNLNTGVLMITGAGSRTIDGFANVSLYKNDSLQLLGVNNIEYTGWATISADGGVS